MQGVWTALITPFNRNLDLDLDAFRSILRDQKQAKVSGVIPCGTTGESPTLTLEEKKKLVGVALEELKGTGVGAIAGTGTNNTAETIEFSKWASHQGVDGVLVVTPYYNKPSQSGLMDHFRTVADAVKCDVMLYNVPGRTGVSLNPETIVDLASHPRIRALKEATGNVAFTSEILDHLEMAGKKLSILSGDDATYMPLLSVGAEGVVSVASNLFPRAMVQIHSFINQGDLTSARALHQKYYPLFRDLFVESNPGPIKAAMAYAGWCEPFLRRPLAPLGSASQNKLISALQRCQVREGTRSAL